MTTEAATTVTPAVLRALPLPAPCEDKDGNGRVLVVGGSRRSPGAVWLAAEAVLRAGAGRVTIATVGEWVAGLAVSVPEAGIIPLPGDGDGAIDLDTLDGTTRELQRAGTVLVGPGLVDLAHADQLVARLLPRVDGVPHLDGLATVHLRDHPEALHRWGGRAMVTTNPNELALVAGLEEDEVRQDPLPVTREVARRCRCVLVCGGTAKYVVAPDGEAWVVQGGGPGLGASGSGDVQAGILTGLLARGAAPPRAALWAAALHARAGERLAAEVGPLGFLARELPAQLPAVLREIG